MKKKYDNLRHRYKRFEIDKRKYKENLLKSLALKNEKGYEED